MNVSAVNRSVCDKSCLTTIELFLSLGNVRRQSARLTYDDFGAHANSALFESTRRESLFLVRKSSILSIDPLTLCRMGRCETRIDVVC